MKTEIIDCLNGDYKASVSHASELLRGGAVVAIPTETVYGLAANCFDEDAVSRVFAAKGRPQDNPLIVHISDLEMLSRVAVDVPEVAYKCAAAFWPGPFTMILKRNPDVPASISAGLDTVAVRMPIEKISHDIIKASNLPLAAPSANISGKPSPTTAKHVINDMLGKIDAVVCGNDCEFGVESTVITLVGEHPRLLRPGAVTAEQLKTVLPDIEIDKAVLSELKKGEKAASPGMKYKHYSPETDTYLVEGSSKAFVKYVNNKKDSAAACFNIEYDRINIKKIVYGIKDDESTLAKNVFSVLRDSDSLGVKSLYVHAPSKSGIGLAVYNRLIRAAAFKVIKLKTVVGLTGPTGAGKSTLSIVAKEMGIQTIDCDLVAREAVEKGTDGLSALTAAFGKDILLPDGLLNRKALAQKAFADKEHTELLNKTILPYIVTLIKEKMTEDNILLDAPTLFESGISDICTETVAVLSDDGQRLSRIMMRDDIDEKSARLRMSAGKSDDFYKNYADTVIYNNGTFEEMKIKAEEYLKTIFERNN